MHKYIDLKAAAYILQALGVITLLILSLAALASQDVFLMLYGIFGFVWWYSIGGALLVLVDIARAVRISAIIAVEQDERRKAEVKPKPSSNGKPLGLRRITPQKVRKA